MSDLNQIHAALQRPSLNDGQYRDCYGSAFGHRLSPGRQSKEFWTWELQLPHSVLNRNRIQKTKSYQIHTKPGWTKKRLRRARGNCINTLTPPLLTLNLLILAAMNVLFPVCPMLS